MFLRRMCQRRLRPLMCREIMLPCFRPSGVIDERHAARRDAYRRAVERAGETEPRGPGGLSWERRRLRRRARESHPPDSRSACPGSWLGVRSSRIRRPAAPGGRRPRTEDGAGRRSRHAGLRGGASRPRGGFRGSGDACVDAHAKATHRIRTGDLCFTKALLDSGSVYVAGTSGDKPESPTRSTARFAAPQAEGGVPVSPLADPDLDEVCSRWEELPAPIRAGILAMVRAAAVRNEPPQPPAGVSPIND